MYEWERIHKQLNDYYSLTRSIIYFLEKYLKKFHKALINYSFVLKHIQEQSTNLLSKTNHYSELTTQLSSSFLSLIKTFNDEYHYLEQRASFLKVIQFTIKNIKRQINSSISLKQKNKLNKYTYRLIRSKNRQYSNPLVQQMQKHDKLSLTWKDNLDSIKSQTIHLLWKFVSYSTYNKSNIESMLVSSSLTTNIIVPCIETNQPSEQLCSSMEIGSGDQLQSTLTKDTISNEFNYDQRKISNSNNALVVVANSKKDIIENKSIYSTDIDETIVENNRFDDDLIDDDDNQWIELVKKNEIQWHKSTLSISTDYISDDEIIHSTYIHAIRSKNALHLSDISDTTDYYSQNESD